MLLRSFSWSESAVAMIYRQMARARSRRDGKMGEMPLARHAWLNAMVELDAEAGARLTDAAEFKHHTFTSFWTPWTQFQRAAPLWLCRRE